MGPPSRRARQAAAVTLAASASLRALPLRRVLLVIVLAFVLLPLVVYNVAVTLDFGSPAAASSSSFFRGAAASAGAGAVRSEPLPRCLDVSSAAFLSREGLSRVHSECTTLANASAVSAVSEKRSEGGGEETEGDGPLVHFVHVPLDAVQLLEDEKHMPAVEREVVTFLQFAAVQSVRKLVRPRVMLLHYVEREPRGVWYTQCQRHLSLHRVLAPKIAPKAVTSGVKAKAKGSNPKKRHLNVHQRRQLMEFLLMLRVLYKQGGVAFSDFNTFVLRDTLRTTASGTGFSERVVVASHAAASGDGVLRVGVHTLQAPANHALLKFLELELLSLIAGDDAKLYQVPLEELVGQLVLQKYKQEQSETLAQQARTPAAPATPATADSAVATQDVVVGSSLLFEGMPLHKIPSLLSATVEKESTSATAVSFRGVSAFHVDKYDFRLKRNDTDPLKAIQALERSIVDAEDALEDEHEEKKLLVHALLRFAIGLNATAELDPYF